MYVLYVCVFILCVHMPKGVYVYMNDWILWYQFVMDSIMEIRTHEWTLSSRDGMQWAESSFSWLWRSKCPQWGKLVKRRLNNQHTHSWKNSSCVWFNHVQLSAWCANAETQCNTVYPLQGCLMYHQVCHQEWTSVHATYGSPHQHSWELEGFPEDSAERLLSPGDLPPATATTCDPLISRFCCSQCLVVLMRFTEWLTSTVCQWQTMSSAICDISKRDHQPLLHENLCFHHSWTHWPMYLLKP